jgi:Protein of unknown function (DUF2778)
MIRCTFHLNGGQLSTLSCPGIGFFPAYSGNSGHHRNNSESISVKKIGPLPTAKYYIVSRNKGGIRSRWHDMIKELESGSNRDLWFALYRDDGAINDHTFIKDVERGFFRLHPAGKSGISEGCITLPSHSDFDILYSALIHTSTMPIASGLNAFGTVQVF